MEARPAVLADAGQARQDQSDQSRSRQSRHNDGGAINHRCGVDQGAVRATRPQSAEGRQHRHRCELCSEADSCNLGCATDVEEIILREGADTIAAIFLEPVQNTGGCFVPVEGYFAEVRRICDKYDILFVSDEAICAFGRLGHMFGCQRFGYLPDRITCAKGLTSGYFPMGR
jgi:adenosylmethionine-8-amino-7-oxononanoate aminotransferase